jgi:hypothetical protein
MNECRFEWGSKGVRVLLWKRERECFSDRVTKWGGVKVWVRTTHPVGYWQWVSECVSMIEGFSEIVTVVECMRFSEIMRLFKCKRFSEIVTVTESEPGIQWGSDSDSDRARELLRLWQWLSASQWFIEIVTVVECESVISWDSDSGCVRVSDSLRQWQWLSASQWFIEIMTMVECESVISWDSDSGWVRVSD